MEDIREKMKDLVEKLNHYAYEYYTLDEPTVDDKVYDKLFDELESLEKETGIVLPDSPTRRVGYKVLDVFEKHTHLHPLLSLDKAKTREEILSWITRTNRLVDAYNLGNEEKLPEAEYIVEYKFDGLTINLTYEDGLLVKGATRGNGYVGEDVTEQIMTINSIPLSIPYKGKIEVQGEGVMTLSKLVEYNEKHEEKLKNARNAAAGAIRNLDPGKTRERMLDCYFYNVGYIEEDVFSSQEEMLDFLRENKFKVFESSKRVHSEEEIADCLDYIDENRTKIDVLTDGAVIKINDLKTREVLGFTNRFPRWALAYKFEAEEFETKVLDVIWNVGRTGKLTPVAILSPVDINGATVQRATLNNIDDIRRKNVKINSEVLIRRSNEVIPEILRALEGNEEEEIEINIPDSCPSCGSELVEDGVNTFCSNPLECPSQLIYSLSHFASRDAMNIEGLSEKTAEVLYRDLEIKDISDIYKLSMEDLLSLEGFKEKKAGNLLAAIEKSKNPNLRNFIYGLGIRFVGVKTSRDLENNFKTLDNIKNASLEDLLSVPDIGEVTARSIYTFFREDRILEVLERLEDYGLKIEEAEETQEKTYKFQDKSFVITGSFKDYKRKDLEEVLESFGLVSKSSVSKNTDFLIVGEKPGSKLEKAQSLGVQIIEEDKLNDFLEEVKE